MPIPYQSSQIGEKQEEFVSGLFSTNDQNVSVFLSSIQKYSLTLRLLVVETIESSNLILKRVSLE